jgi:hypothetical protein
MREIYEYEKSLIQNNIKKAQELQKLNDYIKNLGGAFIHPYLFGNEIKVIKDSIETNTLDKDKVFQIFTNSFFDLRTTTAFIDGYCKRIEYIEPFCLLIDQSVIMCLQKDYAGAINTLIPVIEGVMRNYIISRIETISNHNYTNKENLIPSFEKAIIQDYQSYRKFFYENKYNDLNNILEANQLKQLLKYEREYLNIWLLIFNNYLDKNLYADTRGNTPIFDNLNRHSIFHGFNADIYYSLGNYLRVLHCIYFLSWLFAEIQGFSVPNISTDEIIYKWKAFEKIKLISDFTTSIKLDIYNKYDKFKLEEFSNYQEKTKIEKEIEPILFLGIEHKIEAIDDIFDSYKDAEITYSKSAKFFSKIVHYIFTILKIRIKIYLKSWFN